MANFQRCIGQFTPDVKVELSDLGTKLACGRKVRVVGGIMQGYEGEIIDVEDDPGKRVFFCQSQLARRLVGKHTLKMCLFRF